MNIFRRWLSPKTEQNNKDCHNPWAGLASYEDPDTAKRKLKFCGRDDESYDLTKLIIGNVFVTLYGKSGIGKTSLLNAGVFPELRKEKYIPIRLRLGLKDENNPICYQLIIINAIEHSISRIETIDVIEEQTDTKAIDYLWNYFARHRFYDTNEEPTTLVIVFDQFEEVFRKDRKEAEILLQQIDYINDKDHTLDNSIVDGHTYHYMQNYRFVVSIREDDLYRLEDSLDNCYLPALKRCRYRLRSLSYEGARDAILIPGQSLFNIEEQDKIVDIIIQIARNKEDNSISTNLLSLVCSRIFADFHRQKSSGHINKSLVESFVKGNPFERFYNEATHGLSNCEKSYIENHFVDSTGRRNSLPESDFLLNVKNGSRLLQGDTRILQRTSTSSDGNSYRIELIHDSFCKPLSNQKEKREKHKNRMRIFYLLTSVLIIIGIAIFIIIILSIRERKMLISQSRLLAEKASLKVDEGDSYIARLLALEALPQNLNNQKRPYTAEAEAALRKACANKSYILEDPDGFDYMHFSHNGKLIVSATYDGTIKLWNTQTGECLTSIRGNWSERRDIKFSPNDLYFVSVGYMDTIKIYSTESGKEVRKMKGHSCVDFSHDGKTILTGYGEGIGILDFITGQCLRTFDNKDILRHVSYSLDSKYIVACNTHSINIWNAENGKSIKMIKDPQIDFVSAEFSPDGENIVFSSTNNTIKILDIKTGICKLTIVDTTNVADNAKNHCPAKFSPDGKYIIRSSFGPNTMIANTVKVWNAYTGKCVQQYKVPTYVGITQVEYSFDGNYIASTSWDNSIRVRNILGSSCFTIKGDTTYEANISGYLNNHVTNASISYDGKYLTTALDDNIIKIWDIASSKCIKTLMGNTNKVGKLIFSPSDYKIASSYIQDSIIIIWDAITGKKIRNLRGHKEIINSLSFSDDGKYILSTSNDSTVKIWDISTGEWIREYKHQYVKYAVLSHFNDFTISAGEETALWNNIGNKYIFDLEETKEGDDGKFLLFTEPVFCPNDTHIAKGSWNNSIKIWDIRTGNCIKTLTGHTESISHLVYSQNGRYIISSSLDSSIKIWDEHTGDCIRTLKGHTRGINSLSLSPNGKYILSSASDCTTKVWDFETGTCIQTFDGHSDYVKFSFFSPDGKRIISVSNDNTVKIWEFPPLQQLIDTTHERFKNRPLTPEERHKYYIE